MLQSTDPKVVSLLRFHIMVEFLAMVILVEDAIDVCPICIIEVLHLLLESSELDPVTWTVEATGSVVCSLFPSNITLNVSCDVR